MKFENWSGYKKSVGTAAKTHQSYGHVHFIIFFYSRGFLGHDLFAPIDPILN